MTRQQHHGLFVKSSVTRGRIRKEVGERRLSSGPVADFSIPVQTIIVLEPVQVYSRPHIIRLLPEQDIGPSKVPSNVPSNGPSIVPSIVTSNVTNIVASNVPSIVTSNVPRIVSSIVTSALEAVFG